MKATSKDLLVPLNGKDLIQLTTEVREEIFIDARHKPKGKPFSVAALWRIQKQKKLVRLIRH